MTKQITPEFNNVTAPNSSAPEYDPELWNGTYNKSKISDLIKNPQVDELMRMEFQWYFEVNEDVNQPYIFPQLILNYIHRAERFDQNFEELENQYGIEAKTLKHIYEEFKTLGLEYGEGYQAYNNCYAYAMDDADRNQPNNEVLPGARNDFYIEEDISGRATYQNWISSIKTGLEKDGVKFLGKTMPSPENIPKGHYAIAFYTSSEAYIPTGSLGVPKAKFDMHFVRQDRGGGWSHKLGYGLVTDLDDNKEKIVDPTLANIGNFEFQGYCLVTVGTDVGHTKYGSDVQGKNTRNEHKPWLMPCGP